MKSTVVKALALCAGLVAIQNVSYAKDEEKFELRHARICDPSGCYIAWKVIDSDGDGVCDADELMAGSNPYDPLSTPSLRVVVELESKALLPSFEAGQGAFFVYSIELQSRLKESITEQLAEFGIKQRESALAGAFTMFGEQKDTLTRLGISSKLLTEYGIDLQRDSFTLGLDHSSSKDGLPEKKVAGINVSWISAEPEDCCFPIVPMGGKVTFDDGNGNRITEYDNGNTLLEHANGSGEYFDKNGKLITTFYVNPDADQGSTAPTKEQFEAFERLHGATIRTVEGWSAPTTDVKPEDRRKTIMLIDGDSPFNPAMIYDTPSMTTAQPESRPDLPGIDVPANPGGVKGGCDFGCSP
ncbi:MAG TPA: thrombospondin type 3 repeat-containing protein [Steroidobacteraceae bacterium]|nr:thrombospondin type 3 repeat-containing protein [Steroidobacteraceae bacterium]